MIKKPQYILIIGNGFDLNLGLETAYTNFIQSNFFQELTTKNMLCGYLNNRHGLKNWIDIENELKIYSNEIDDEDFEDNYNELCDSLMNYLDSLDYELINTSSKAYQVLEKIKDLDFLIIDFNYTLSTEILLKKFGLNDEKIKERLIKIHGTVKERKIIFGVEDKARIDRSHVFLKKSFNSNFTPIHFKTVFDNASNIVFFGHSLGETDHMYFHIFLSELAIIQHNKNIYIHHFGKKAYTEIFMQLDTLTNNSLSGFRQNNTFKTIDVSIA